MRGRRKKKQKKQSGRGRGRGRRGGHVIQSHRVLRSHRNKKQNSNQKGDGAKSKEDNVTKIKSKANKAKKAKAKTKKTKKVVEAKDDANANAAEDKHVQEEDDPEKLTLKEAKKRWPYPVMAAGWVWCDLIEAGIKRVENRSDPIHGVNYDYNGKPIGTYRVRQQYKKDVRAQLEQNVIKQDIFSIERFSGRGFEKYSEDAKGRIGLVTSVAVPGEIYKYKDVRRFIRVIGMLESIMF